MTKNKIIQIIIILILIISFYSFFKINNLNYQKHNDIKKSFVKHPENLPTKNTAKNTAFWFKNLRADIYWLESIQYVWSNAIWADYKKYLFTMLDIITELNPYFKHPYIIWQLLLPEYNQRYEDLDKNDQKKYINQSEELWLKWIKNFCDENKIKLIIKQTDLRKIWSEEKYKNPCKEYELPYYLAYIYHFYKKDPKTASIYYKITSANEDSLEWAKVLAAIMTWRWGEREKSYFMFLNIAQSVEKNNLVCNKFSSELEKVGIEIFINKNFTLNKQILKNISHSRDLLFGKFSEEREEDLLWDTKCWNYLNKAIRELNLEYIEKADELYFKKYNKHSLDASELLKKWFINYLPLDYQQYDDYWIIYEYDNETKNYNYSLWSYNK